MCGGGQPQSRLDSGRHFAAPSFPPSHERLRLRHLKKEGAARAHRRRRPGCSVSRSDSTRAHSLTRAPRLDWPDHRASERATSPSLFSLSRKSSRSGGQAASERVAAAAAALGTVLEVGVGGSGGDRRQLRAAVDERPREGGGGVCGAPTERRASLGNNDGAANRSFPQS